MLQCMLGLKSLNFTAYLLDAYVTSKRRHWFLPQAAWILWSPFFEKESDGHWERKSLNRYKHEHAVSTTAGLYNYLNYWNNITKCNLGAFVTRMHSLPVSIVWHVGIPLSICSSVDVVAAVVRQSSISYSEQRASCSQFCFSQKTIDIALK